jgi:N-acetylmuramoyl-L-alanine amidase
VAALGLLLALGSVSAAETNASVPVDEGIRARIVDGRTIVLEVLPEPGEGYLAMARRLCGDPDLAHALEAANASRGLFVGRPALVPWDLLRSEYRYLSLLALFPEDEFARGAWHHRPGQSPVPVVGEGLWQVAEWYTGRGENWVHIARANGIAGPDLPPGRSVHVPAELLLPLFRPPVLGPERLLRYDRDEQGPFAEYRLRRGEALYSAVVLRFTGVLAPDDEGMREMVEIIAERSGIGDVRRIPTGHAVKIPLELLSLPFLPHNHPRKVLAQVRQSEMRALSLPRRPSTFDGVHVILDSGHGGIDVGARLNGVWESDYTYDVACRIRRLLEREPGATVHMVMRDLDHGYRVFESRQLPLNRREVVNTDPPHANKNRRDVKVGVNLRWYFANDRFEQLVGNRKASPEKVIFVSLHADSLHQSLRGAMVYVPGSGYRAGNHAVGGSAYRRYREYSRAPVSFTRSQRLRDEALSTKLAERILDGFRDQDLHVHLNMPVRDHIVKRVHRHRRPSRYVPAVLRANAVPAKVLVELVNLNNREDAHVMADPAGRERMAKAIVAGLRDYLAAP